MGSNLSILGDNTPVNTNVSEKEIFSFFDTLSTVTTGTSFATQIEPKNIAITRRRLTDILATLLFSPKKNQIIRKLLEDKDNNYDNIQSKIDTVFRNIYIAVSQTIIIPQQITQQKIPRDVLFPTDCLLKLTMIKMILTGVFSNYEVGVSYRIEHSPILKSLSAYCDIYLPQYEEAVLLLLKWVGYNTAELLRYYRKISPIRRSMDIENIVTVNPANTDASYPGVVLHICEHINQQILQYHRLDNPPSRPISLGGTNEFTGFRFVANFIHTFYHTFVNHYHNEQVTDAIIFTVSLLLRQRTICLVEWTKSWHFLLDMLSLELHKEHIVRFIVSIMTTTLEHTTSDSRNSLFSEYQNQNILPKLQYTSRIMSTRMFEKDLICQIVPVLMVKLLHTYSQPKTMETSGVISGLSPIVTPQSNIQSNKPSLVSQLCQLTFHLLQYPSMYQCLMREESLIKLLCQLLTKALTLYRNDKPLTHILFMLACTISNDNDISREHIDFIKAAYEINQWHGCAEVLLKVLDKPNIFQNLIIHWLERNAGQRVACCTIITIRCRFQQNRDGPSEQAIFAAIPNVFELVSTTLPNHWVKDEHTTCMVSQALSCLLDSKNSDLRQTLKSIALPASSLFRDDNDMIRKVLNCLNHHTNHDVICMNLLTFCIGLCECSPYYRSLFAESNCVKTLFHVLKENIKRNKSVSNLIVDLVWMLMSELPFHVNMIDDQSIFPHLDGTIKTVTTPSLEGLIEKLSMLDEVIPGSDIDTKIKTFFLYISLASSSPNLTQVTYELQNTAVLINQKYDTRVPQMGFGADYLVTLLEPSATSMESTRFVITTLAWRLRYREEQHRFNDSHDISSILINRLKRYQHDSEMMKAIALLIGSITSNDTMAQDRFGQVENMSIAITDTLKRYKTDMYTVIYLIDAITGFTYNNPTIQLLFGKTSELFPLLTEVSQLYNAFNNVTAMSIATCLHHLAQHPENIITMGRIHSLCDILLTMLNTWRYDVNIIRLICQTLESLCQDIVNSQYCSQLGKTWELLGSLTQHHFIHDDAPLVITRVLVAFTKHITKPDKNLLQNMEKGSNMLLIVFRIQAKVKNNQQAIQRLCQALLLLCEQIIWRDLMNSVVYVKKESLIAMDVVLVEYKDQVELVDMIIKLKQYFV